MEQPNIADAKSQGEFNDLVGKEQSVNTPGAPTGEQPKPKNRRWKAQ